MTESCFVSFHQALGQRNKSSEKNSLFLFDVDVNESALMSWTQRHLNSDVRKSTEVLTSDDETESIAFFVQRHLHVFEHDPWALYS